MSTLIYGNRILETAKTRQSCWYRPWNKVMHIENGMRSDDAHARSMNEFVQRSSLDHDLAASETEAMFEGNRATTITYAVYSSAVRNMDNMFETFTTKKTTHKTAVRQVDRSELKADLVSE